jgi:hypothetical protein
MSITLKPRGEARIRNGHPWVYRSDVEDVSAERGQVVLVRGRRKTPLGYALYSDRSEIALRLVTRSQDAPTLETWASRLDAAVLSRVAGIDATAMPGHGADRLPDSWSIGMAVTGPAFVKRIDRLLPDDTAARRAIEPDPRTQRPGGATAEGEQAVTVLHGTAMIEIREGRVRTSSTLPRPEDRVVP